MTKTVLASELLTDDVITTFPPKVRIISKKPLTSKYMTQVEGYILEVAPLNPKYKGFIQELVLLKDDKVRMAARPGPVSRFLKWIKKRKEEKHIKRAVKRSVFQAEVNQSPPPIPKEEAKK